MTYPFKLLFFLFLLSCQQPDKTNNNDQCRNKIELLKGVEIEDVEFDFSLTKEQQVEQLKKQTEASLCHGFTRLNGNFKVYDKNLETLLVVDWLCEDSTKPPIEKPCILIRSISILINSQNRILIDGEIVKTDSVPNLIRGSSKKFWENEYRLVSFQIDWDKKSDLIFRKQIFESVVKGYLLAADEISQSEYNKALCELDKNSLQSLKDKFQFALLLKKAMPPPQFILEKAEVDSGTTF